MIFGSLYIYSCPGCNTSVMQATLKTSNNIGAIYYSDGSIIGLMSLEFCRVTKCNRCSTIFWLNNENHVALIRWEDLPKNNPVPFAKPMSLRTCIQAIDARIYSGYEEELYLRQYYWRQFNHLKRLNESEADDEDLFLFWEGNCRELIKMINLETEEPLMMAELLRNLGKFKESEDVLYNINGPTFSSYREQLLNACKTGNRFTIEFKAS